MKKRVVTFSFASLIGAIIMSLLVGVVAMAITEYLGGGYAAQGDAGLVSTIVSFGLSLIPGDGKIKNLAFAGIQKEIWTNYIDENLYKDNSFLEQSMDHSEYVDNLTVHSPQSGDDGEVVENRTMFPATVTSRTDTTVDWDINEYTASPWKISNAEEVELSYNKLESMLYSRRAILDQKIADGALYAMAPTGTAQLRNAGGTNNNIFRSSGVPNMDLNAAKVYSAGYLPSTSGVLKLNFGLYDILEIATYFDDNNIPKADRHLACSSRALRQIINDITVSKYRDSISEFNTTEGTIKRLLGFEFHVRSTIVRYDSSLLPVAKAQSAAAAATDNDAIICWQKAAVRRAKGETKVYDDADRPEYYGKLFSLLKRFGMSISRNDELGVAAIVQQNYVPAGN